MSFSEGQHWSILIFRQAPKPDAMVVPPGKLIGMPGMFIGGASIR